MARPGRHGPAEAVDAVRETTWWGWFQRTWPDGVNFTVGAWMVLSAFVPAFSGHPPGPLASGVSGLAIILVSLAAAWRVTPGKEVINLALGLWLIAAPWALGLTTFDPFWNFVGDGLFLVAHAAYQLARPPRLRPGF